MLRHTTAALFTALVLGLAATGCDGVSTDPSSERSGLAEAASPTVSAAASGVLGGQGATGPSPVARAAQARSGDRGRGPAAGDEVYGGIDPAVYDIAAAPDGSVLFTQDASVKQVRFGEVSHVTDLPAVGDDFGRVTTANGLAVTGRRSFFATTGGTDAALGAGLWHVTASGPRLVGDIEAFETDVNPDETWWKNAACEEVEEDPDTPAPEGYTAGPQSNPYHLTTDGGRTALVADAAGNALLAGGVGGGLDWVAVFAPPTADGSASADPADWLVLFELPDETCYVQPVPTSVAVGPDGAYYVGELTGAITASSGVSDIRGLARVWRIEPGARNVRCPSDQCELALSGLTSVIDLAFGPDGALHVVEYDEAGWLGLFTGSLEGGTVSRCEVGGAPDASAACSPVAGGLFLPSAITFDKRGGLWLLEGNITGPTIRQLDLG